MIFRFTNIGDAVNFKAQLTREDDWEHCNIQFTADPYVHIPARILEQA